MKTSPRQDNKRSTKTTLYRLFFLALLFTLGKTPELVANENGRLEEYIQLALEQNKEILSAESRVAEATAKIRQAGAFPDPQLGLQYYLQPVETRTGPQEASISLKQSIPWPTKLSLDKQLKKNEADIAKANLVKTRFSVIRKVKEAFVEYGYLGQATKITSQILELMNYLEGILHTNYSSGNASYSDVLKIQIEIDKLKNRQLSLEDNLTPLRVRLNNIIGSDRNMARPMPDMLPQISLNREEDEIFSLVKEYNPILMAGNYKINHNRIKLNLADQGFFPDLALSVKTIFTGDAEFGNPPDSGRDPVIAGISFNIPLFFGQRNATIAEKQAAVRTARNDLEEAANILDSKIEMLLFRYREAERLLNLYTSSLLPKIRQELDVALEAFQSGHYSILTLIDTEKDWLNFELAKIRAQADMAIQIARLEELTGTTLIDWKQKVKP